MLIAFSCHNFNRQGRKAKWNFQVFSTFTELLSDGPQKFIFRDRTAGPILTPPPTYAVGRKGTQRLRCSRGRCSRPGSLKAAFRCWYQDAPFTAAIPIFARPV